MSSEDCGLSKRKTEFRLIIDCHSALITQSCFLTPQMGFFQQPDKIQEEVKMGTTRVRLLEETERNMGMKRLFFSILTLAWMAVVVIGCSHYPINQPLKQVDPQSGYRGKYTGTPGNSENLLLYLTFSGGGTRAAALSYGVLEELRKTEVVIDGRKRRLLDEIDGISSVSGGSFTAGYYGLFGDRIFEDFEIKFLKKNIQGGLTARTFLNPINWFRLSSTYFDRSDLAAEYYDKHVFEGKT
ncbi:MAG: Patatin, partial [Deltaproteobacteria bacterium]|nr:Patatin [Deltaproteobacteria bacterium]